MSNSISRRNVAKGAAWAAPAVALASAAPAQAASCTPWNNWDYHFEHVQYVGADGALGTVSFWTVVTPGVKPANGCKAPEAVTTETITVNVLRNAGGINRFRPVTLTQADRVTTDIKTHDVAQTSTHPVGSLDYQWTITFNPLDVYNLNGQHRFYTTMSAGDGGVTDGRITNLLQLNGVTQTFENQGDQVF
ncbi:hypothetical protein [Falsarthrobacter nasiphocae]|uniref:Secreted protein n=1 Tax=Falsarthrobacter nasiphocae TaxID=189863 RepID=A0AAE4C6S6_9MICC|nr:hypothetical protein [Falsarthrobacter nasiphocae]MDR6892898.1 hypothetical protein [Falsarthrobacter nasiphocae]